MKKILYKYRIPNNEYRCRNNELINNNNLFKLLIFNFSIKKYFFIF